MRKVILFIAMSLDGYIADAGGGVDWLQGQDPAVEPLDTYTTFIKDVDTVLMGRKTHHQIVTELSPGMWVYDGQLTYVFTHHQQPDADGIRFVNADPVALVRQLQTQAGKDIWICGGADIVRQLMQADLIDRYRITVIPTLLGGGVRLFEETGKAVPLRLLHTSAKNGMVELIYARR